MEFDRSLTAEVTVAKLKELAKRPQSPVPAKVLRLARDQAMNEEEEDDEEEGDLASAPVDCGKHRHKWTLYHIVEL